MAKERLGLEVIVRGRWQEVANEVKRMGYLKDREVPLQVRVGDRVVLYVNNVTA